MAEVRGPACNKCAQSSAKRTRAFRTLTCEIAQVEAPLVLEDVAVVETNGNQAVTAEPEVCPPMRGNGLYAVRVPKPIVAENATGERKKLLEKLQVQVTALKAMNAKLSSKRVRCALSWRPQLFPGNAPAINCSCLGLERGGNRSRLAGTAVTSVCPPCIPLACPLNVRTPMLLAAWQDEVKALRKQMSEARALKEMSEPEYQVAVFKGLSLSVLFWGQQKLPTLFLCLSIIGTTMAASRASKVPSVPRRPVIAPDITAPQLEWQLGAKGCPFLKEQRTQVRNSAEPTALDFFSSRSLSASQPAVFYT